MGERVGGGVGGVGCVWAGLEATRAASRLTSNCVTKNQEEERGACPPEKEHSETSV